MATLRGEKLTEVYRIRISGLESGGFSTFWANRIGSCYSFIQVSGSGSGFSNCTVLGFDANTII